MKLKIVQPNLADGKPRTEIIDAVSAQRIPVDLSGNVEIHRDGELPWKITSLADGVVVQWKDGYYVILEPAEDADFVPRQISINDSAADPAPLPSFMTWVASHHDSPLDFAPLGVYSLPSFDRTTDDRFQPHLPAEPVKTVVVAPPPPAPALVLTPVPVPPPNLPPTINEGNGVTVEPQLLNGSHTITGDTTVSGKMNATDPNADSLAFTLNAPPEALTSHAQAVTWIGGGTDHLVGSAGGVPVIDVVIDNTGAYTFKLVGPVDQPAGGDPGVLDMLSLHIGVTVTDPGGLSASTTLTIGIVDDIPSMVLAEGQNPAVSVDESFLPIGSTPDAAQTHASGNFSSAFTSAYGADGPGSIVYTLGISAHGADSGLIDSASGQHDVLVLNAVTGEVEGHVGNAAGAVAFTIAVDSGTGVVTLTQILAVHEGTGEAGDISEGISLDSVSNLVSLAATITDFDGDIAKASIDLGKQLSFLDDGPSVTVGAVAESGITLTTHDALTIGVAFDTASASFASAFAAAVTPDYHADGPGTTVVSGYTLSVTDSASGLTSDGLAITLAKVGNDVVGSTTAGEVFHISVNATGTVTLTQSAELDHLPESLNTSNDNNDIALLNGKVSLGATATVTDGDNDQVTSGVSIDLGGNIHFIDDLPSVTVGAVAESGITLTTHDALTIGVAFDTASASFASAFAAAVTPDYHADGPGTTVVSGYTLSVTDSASGLTSDGLAITLAKVGNDVVGSTTAGEVFHISVNATGTVTLTQSAELDHLGAGNNTQIALANGKVSLAATATVTDGDNDQATAPVSVDLGGNIRFDDDVPTVLAGAATVTHDETTGVQTLLGAQDTLAGLPAAFVAELTGLTQIGHAHSSLGVVSINGGADGLTNVQLTNAAGSMLSAVDSGLTTSASGGVNHIFLYTDGTNDNVVFGMEGAGAIANAAGAKVFAVYLDQTDSSLWLSQFLAIEHNTASGPDTSEAASILNTIYVTAVDGDGDKGTSAAAITVSFLDDGPSLVVNDIAEVGRVANTIASGTYTFQVGADVNTFDGSFGAAALAWTNPGAGIDFHLKAGFTHTYEATYLDNSVIKTFFEITLNSNGTYDFKLVNPAPSLSITADVLSGVSGGSGLTNYLIPASTFGGAFSLLLTGFDSNPGADTLTISSTDLGVNGNSIQQHSGEGVRFDVQPQPGFETTTLNNLTVHLSSTGSLTTGDHVQLLVHYSTGADAIVDVTYNNSGVLNFAIDPSRIVDYVDMQPTSNNVTMKVTGVELSYTHTVDPADIALQFNLTGLDHDGDSASDPFTVTLISGTSGNDTIVTSTGNDQITGGAGNDTITGGSGNDTFRWVAGDAGTVGTPAVDTIKDFSSVAGNTDRVDLSGLLLGETHSLDNSSAGNLASYLHFSLSGANTILEISSIGAFAAAAETSVAALGAGFDQKIIFEGVNFVGANTHQDTLITSLLAGGKLFTDPTPASPVVLDLNHDGVQFLAHDDPANHVLFDYRGDGQLEHSAWASSHDGILVHDANGDRVANNGSEITFADPAHGAYTDLQGLLLHYDTNHDGVLDARDTEFAHFGVWQDANSNGITDTGEFHTLTEAGIASLNLISDGQTSLAANGEVLIHGQTNFTLADGTHGALADASFAVFPDSVASTSDTQSAPTLDHLLSGTSSTVDAILPQASQPVNTATTGDAAPIVVASADATTTTTATTGGDSHLADATTTTTSGDAHDAASTSTVVASADTSSSDPAPVHVPELIAHVEGAPAAVA